MTCKFRGPLSVIFQFSVYAIPLYKKGEVVPKDQKQTTNKKPRDGEMTQWWTWHSALVEAEFSPQHPHCNSSPRVLWFLQLPQTRALLCMWPLPTHNWKIKSKVTWNELVHLSWKIATFSFICFSLSPTFLWPIEKFVQQNEKNTP